MVTEGAREALRLVAGTEGIILDPVYSAKAMAGLIDHARTGRIGPGQTVVFVHTGGTPALFAYAAELGLAPPVQSGLLNRADLCCTGRTALSSRQRPDHPFRSGSPSQRDRFPYAPLITSASPVSLVVCGLVLWHLLFSQCWLQ